MALLLVGCYGYLAVLFGWWVLQQMFGDRWWWLFLLNLFAVYLFLPLPLVLLVAVRSQQPLLWGATGLALGLALALYGRRFWPRLARPPAGAPTVTVLTFNALAYSTDTPAVITAIRQAQADIVALQELNPAVGAALSAQLHDSYPYQALLPRADSRGMGVISRYPLTPLAQSIAGEWLGPPQICQLDFAGRPILFLNCHAISVIFNGRDLRSFTGIHRTVPAREVQMQALADFAAAQPLPLIAVGDFNTGDQTQAYRYITQVLHDAWQQGGWGWGHTFPGALSPASSRAVIWGIPVPMWLIRIDYLFHSRHWHTDRAWIGPWDGVSDHRPVVARLWLT